MVCIRNEERNERTKCSKIALGLLKMVTAEPKYPGDNGVKEVVSQWYQYGFTGGTKTWRSQSYRHRPPLRLSHADLYLNFFHKRERERAGNIWGGT